MNIFDIGVADFRIYVDAEFLKGNEETSLYGIIFRSDGEGSAYRFAIAPDGYYGLEVFVNEEFKSSPDFPYSEFIKNNDVNSLMIEMVGQKITLGVNGQILEEIEGDNLTSGQVGVFVATKKGFMAVRFRNFRIYSIDKEEKKVDTVGKPPPTTTAG